LSRRQGLRLTPPPIGKSTLLNLIAGLDRPTGDTITVAGQRIGTLGETGEGRRRNRTASALHAERGTHRLTLTKIIFRAAR
jgi:ABC-type thiamine transport system ATPase subunit